jgi:hypothetical protein
MNTLTGPGLSEFSCTVHEFFPAMTSFPSAFVVLAEAIRPESGLTQPYIIARP